MAEGFTLREKIFHFDRERIPEHVVHAHGFGAHDDFRDFISLSPEAAHMALWIMSGRAASA